MIDEFLLTRVTENRLRGWFFSLDFNLRAEKSLIKCHWNFALQHDDISQTGDRRESGPDKAVSVSAWMEESP